ncbi:type I-D CRISPR-associated helicase Cas3' [Thermogemmatispora tikiterensis]|uniref:Type I-D CRISPR-associated helicase Cas3 n=1 Tax=Thermogemmatispora tikiterensis TaxID=1825093 RepID=A0A328VIB8_9CHLR|nr:type I-D CRISPR-associated helicase Cas3' [Thermogemmatispora tikiterensis]RAQ95520.1 type I-D CRISPR-associated helicase Cas3' [Thermogemmatispora tikiterensis]
MLTIKVCPQEERRWLGVHPLALDSSARPEQGGSEVDGPPTQEVPRLLYHQWRMYQATAPLVINTHATGTGKTLGALLRLLARVRQIGPDQLTPRQGDTLFIAPTNELIEQHAATAREFCQRYGLPYRVVSVTRDALEGYRQGLTTEGYSRLGQFLRHLLSEPATALQEDVSTAKATIFVTNPDIFYYILTACYNRFDRGPLLTEVLRDFSLVIIDEVHYYSPRQLAAFLFFLKLSAAWGYLSGPDSPRQVCLLTATPSVQMRRYLEGLGIETEWIEPQDPVPEAWTDKVEPVRALTPVELAIYSAEELAQDQHSQRQSGDALLSLVQHLWPTLRQLLEMQPADGFPVEGAILSNSLRTINLIYRELQARWPAASERVGRITGPQSGQARDQARERQLILATPTVDIGYNFERTRSEQKQAGQETPISTVRKPRPSLDFLLFDAWSGDELLQRLGRVGRVLALPTGEHCGPCQAWAVVDQESYRLFEGYDGTTIERGTLAKLAAQMPARQNLTAYVRSGAIVEFCRAIGLIGQGMADEELPLLDNFLEDLQRAFAGEQEQRQRPWSYKRIREVLRRYEELARSYGGFSHIPVAAFERFAALLNGQPPDQHDPTIPYLKAFDERLLSIIEHRQEKPRCSLEAIRWLKQDLSQYYVEHARWNFREGFETLQVLVFDPQHLLSDEDVTHYDLFHILRSYEATFFPTVEEWRRACFSESFRWQADVSVNQREKPVRARKEEVILFCRLHGLRKQPRQVGLRLDVPDQERGAWEEQWAYRVTALWGLQPRLINDDSGLPDCIRTCLQERFVPVLVAAEESSTVAWLMSLRQKARFFPVALEVSFADRPKVCYRAVLGPLAWQLAAEIPRWVFERDRRRGQQGESELLFF